MDYRVIISNRAHHPRNPFEVQRSEKHNVGLWFFKVKVILWEHVLLVSSIQEANEVIKRDIQKQKNMKEELEKIDINLSPGSVVYEYTEEDQVVDKLKGKV